MRHALPRAFLRRRLDRARAWRDARRRLAAAGPRLAASPRGDGSPVLVLPGLFGSDLVTWRMRRFLGDRGWTPLPWRLGVNLGQAARLLRRLEARLEAEHAAHRRPLRLVGWSMGGVLARELARERPELVDRVVTLGTPVVGGPKHTTVAPWFERVLGVDVDALAASLADRERRPLTVPVTAIVSRQDGVVAWHALRDPIPGRTHHVEIDTAHLALGTCPDAFAAVARALAE